jgi:hypothetical protein
VRSAITARDRRIRAGYAAGIAPHKPGCYPPPNEITLETKERILSLYLAGSSAKRVALPGRRQREADCG